MNLIVLGELGMIRDSDESPEEREARELEEALAISLSLAPLRDDVIHPAPKAGPPPPPRLARPSPPLEQPSASARLAARLPVLFPPVGHAWNRSPIARWAQRPRRPRRHRRCRFAVPESFSYFPRMVPVTSAFERDVLCLRPMARIHTRKRTNLATTLRQRYLPPPSILALSDIIFEIRRRL